jgi:hypothetical protein
MRVESSSNSYTSSIEKIDFISINFWFDKNMQGYRMHDDAGRHDDAKNKIASNSNNGDFSGSLQSTPLTRDLAPRSTLRLGRRSGLNYRIFVLHVELRDTTNKRFLLTSTMTFPRDPSEDRTY